MPPAVVPVTRTTDGNVAWVRIVDECEAPAGTEPRDAPLDAEQT